jgi:hypothetical protein
VRRVKLSSAVVEIVAGIIVGPSVLGWVKINQPVNVIALIGLAFLLFLAGLEIDLRATTPSHPHRRRPIQNRLRPADDRGCEPRRVRAITLLSLFFSATKGGTARAVRSRQSHLRGRPAIRRPLVCGPGKGIDHTA